MPASFQALAEFTPENPCTWDAVKIDQFGLGWDELAFHPSCLLDEEDFEILGLWRHFRSEMAPGLMPFDGGVARQPSALLACLEHCSATEHRIRERKKK